MKLGDESLCPEAHGDVERGGANRITLARSGNESGPGGQTRARSHSAVCSGAAGWAEGVWGWLKSEQSASRLSRREGQVPGSRL